MQPKSIQKSAMQTSFMHINDKQSMNAWIVAACWLVCWFVFAMFTALLSLPAHGTSWADFTQPLAGKPAAIGSYANGCIIGAQPLALAGEGYQVIRSQRQRYYGHPNLVNFIEQLAKAFKQQNGNDLLIADMSMPRGGRFQSGHRSHQSGLDVDIWFRHGQGELTVAELESPLKQDVVTKGTLSVNQQWQTSHATMIRLAAEAPEVARIFVNPAIKQQLCNMSWQDDTWLQKVRPWWGHSLHMHVRLCCPDSDTECQNQSVIPAGTGCDELAWWQQQLTAPKQVENSPKKPAKPKIKVLHPQCEQILQR
ncbi:penicillin-insensitive murein endopeptidase [Shewanella waksmanii]|uniref:penicillin-insensitive murein endopeptidase n=1 Tax=Shewanella waksmanii TaxID=213783 RepID=UPI003736AB31